MPLRQETKDIFYKREGFFGENTELKKGRDRKVMKVKNREKGLQQQCGK